MNTDSTSSFSSSSSSSFAQTDSLRNILGISRTVEELENPLKILYETPKMEETPKKEETARTEEELKAPVVLPTPPAKWFTPKEKEPMKTTFYPQNQNQQNQQYQNQQQQQKVQPFFQNNQNNQRNQKTRTFYRRSPVSHQSPNQNNQASTSGANPFIPLQAARKNTKIPTNDFGRAEVPSLPDVINKKPEEPVVKMFVENSDTTKVPESTEAPKSFPVKPKSRLALKFNPPQ
jgi:hypothetical protein